MATLASSGLSQNFLKLRWREPYVSEATNIQNTANSPGVYRGGYVSETSPSPSQSFIVTKSSDVDSFFLVTNSSNGTTLAVRFESDITIDMSSRFTGGGGSMPGDETWYVWIEVDYAATSTTTGNVIVSDTAPTGDEVMLAVIDMLNGDTTIQDARIRTDGTAKTLPLRKKALVLPKKENITGLSSDTYFQAGGKVYVGNETVNAKKFTWLAQSGSVDPLVGSDDRLIDVDALYKDSGLTQLVASVDLDEDGFYDSPYVKFDVSRTSDSNYTGDLDFWFYGYYNLEDISTNDDDAVLKFLRTHGDVVQTAPETGSPNSISSDNLQDFIAEVLPLINSRYRDQNATAPSSWVLYFRNEDVADGSVDEKTVSVYYQAEDFVILKGAYLSGTTVYANSIASDNEVCMLRLSQDNGIQIATRKVAASTPTTWTYFSGSSWSTYIGFDDLGIDPVKRITVLNDTVISIKDGCYIDPGVGNIDGDEWKRALYSDYSTYNCGIYVGNSEGTYKYAIGQNLDWDEGSSKWKPKANLSDSFLLETTFGGIYLWRMDRSDSLHDTSAGWTHSQWTSKMLLVDVPSDISQPGGGLQAYVNGNLEGLWLEHFAVAASWENQTGSTTGYNQHVAYNFRYKYESAPTTFVDYEDLDNPVASVSFSSTAYANALAQELGFYIDVDYASIPDGTHAYVHGRVWVY